MTTTQLKDNCRTRLMKINGLLHQREAMKNNQSIYRLTDEEFALVFRELTSIQEQWKLALKQET